MAPWVRRTLAISCEAVPAVSGRRGHEAAPLVWCSRSPPGAAESLVGFIALFDRCFAFLTTPAGVSHTAYEDATQMSAVTIPNTTHERCRPREIARDTTALTQNVSEIVRSTAERVVTALAPT